MNINNSCPNFNINPKLRNSKLYLSRKNGLAHRYSHSGTELNPNLNFNKSMPLSNSATSRHSSNNGCKSRRPVFHNTDNRGNLSKVNKGFAHANNCRSDVISQKIPVGSQPSFSLNEKCNLGISSNIVTSCVAQKYKLALKVADQLDASNNIISDIQKQMLHKICSHSNNSVPYATASSSNVKQTVLFKDDICNKISNKIFVTQTKSTKDISISQNDYSGILNTRIKSQGIGNTSSGFMIQRSDKAKSNMQKLGENSTNQRNKATPNKYVFKTDRKLVKQMKSSYESSNETKKNSIQSSNNKEEAIKKLCARVSELKSALTLVTSKGDKYSSIKEHEVGNEIDKPGTKFSRKQIGNNLEAKVENCNSNITYMKTFTSPDLPKRADRVPEHQKLKGMPVVCAKDNKQALCPTKSGNLTPQTVSVFRNKRKFIRQVRNRRNKIYVNKDLVSKSLNKCGKGNASQVTEKSQSDFTEQKQHTVSNLPSENSVTNKMCTTGKQVNVKYLIKNKRKLVKQVSKIDREKLVMNTIPYSPAISNKSIKRIKFDNAKSTPARIVLKHATSSSTPSANCAGRGQKKNFLVISKTKIITKMPDQNNAKGAIDKPFLSTKSKKKYLKSVNVVCGSEPVPSKTSNRATVSSKQNLHSEYVSRGKPFVLFGNKTLTRTTQKGAVCKPVLKTKCKTKQSPTCGKKPSLQFLVAKSVCSKYKYVREKRYSLQRNTCKATAGSHSTQSRYTLDRRLPKNVNVTNQITKRNKLIQERNMKRSKILLQRRQMLANSLTKSKVWVSKKYRSKLLKPVDALANSSKSRRNKNLTLKTMDIGGVKYKCTRVKLTRKPSQERVKANKRNSSKIKSKNVTKERAIYVRGTKFVMNSTGSTLKRVRDSSLVSSPVDSSPKRIDIGGITYLRKSENVLIRSNNHITRNILSQAKQRSIATLIKKRKKNNQPCLIYQRFGKCRGMESGTCERVHDPKRIAICRKFLEGDCSFENCTLSHNLGPEKMPTCKYFLEGICVKDNCPYLHVKVSENAEICKNFIQGYCSSGNKCKKRHLFLCPDFDKKGICLKGKYCPYPHGSKKKTSRIKRETKKMQEAETMRYYMKEDNRVDINALLEKRPVDVHLDDTVDSTSSHGDAQISERIVMPDFISI